MKRNIVVSGGNGNLGSVVVKKFIAEGDQVYSFVRKKSDVTLFPESVEEIELNLLDEEDSQTAVEKILNKSSAIDVAVLTVGGFTMGSIAKTSTKDIYKQYQLNFETAYNLARPVFLQMLEQGHGRIFLIGSKQGLDTHNAKMVAAYALSKSLLFGLANILNAESQGKDITTSVIVPGIIDTPTNRSDMPDADFSKWVTPEEIADIIYFYSSESAKAIKEPILKVFGGI